MARLIRPLLVAALAAVAFAPSTPAGAAGEVEVTLAAGQFAPIVVQVPAGSNLTFANKDVTNYPLVIGNHNVIPGHVTAAFPGAKEFPTSSNLIAPGGKWTCPASADGGLTCTGLDGKATAVPPGTYAVACGLHPNQMHALIVVQ
jgi:plastocyanin